MYYKISSIMFNSGQKASNASEIFIAQPDEYKESLAGRLFLLLEIESSKSKALKIANFLVNNINYNYYQNEKILLREKIADLKVEHIFETALANVNKDLVEFLQQEKIKISPYAINLTVGVIYKNHLHISSLGKNRNLLIYPDQKEEQTYYKITDIERKQEKNSRAVSFTKLFSDVISGPLPEDGYYFLANEALIEHLSEKQLTEAITKLPPASAATHIKNIIQQINVPVNFLGIIIKNTVNTQEEPEKEDKKGTSHLFNLDRTKEDTEQILKPSGVVNLKGLVKKSGQLFSSQKTSDQSPAPSRTNKERGKKIGTALKKLGALLAALLRKISRITVRIWKKIFKRSPKNEEEISIEKPKKLLGWKSKLVLGGVVIFLIAFLVSVSFNSSENKNQEITQEINELTKQVEKKQNQIDANLLYGNEDKARTLLEEVKTTLLEIKNKLEGSSAPKEEFSEYEQLVQKIKEQVRKIRHVVPLASAQKRTDLADNVENPQAENIHFLNGSWYISDKSKSRIYKTNSDNSQVQTLEAPDLSSYEDSNYTKASDKLYYMVSGGLLELDPENDQTRKIDLDLPPDLQAGGIGGYYDNIYVADKNSGQIYKYEKTYNDLTSREEWMSEGQKISDQVQDIAIDGYIYTLDSAGQVKKYYRGELQEFSLGEISPNWGRTTRIQAPGDPDQGGFLYILDTEKNRIVVFDKQSGDFLRQYQDQEKFSNIKDFYLDSENNTLYFLNNNTLYSQSLEQ